MFNPGEEVIQRDKTGNIRRRGIIKKANHPLYSVEWFEEYGNPIKAHGQHNADWLEKAPETVDLTEMVITWQSIHDLIDIALDTGDKEQFLELTEQLKLLTGLSTK